MGVSVLIPFASGDPWRLLAFEHVVCSYVQVGWEVVVGTMLGPWRKAVAVEDAARRASGDLFVVADADCLCDGVAESVEAVRDGAPWSMPHLGVVRLDEQATGTVYDGTPPHETSGRVEPIYRGKDGGGIVVLPRSTWEDIPLDPRFSGWGQEDMSWALALSTLAGRPTRLRHDLVHLWHPIPERLSRLIGSEEGEALHQRYRAARDRTNRMRSLVDEGKEVLRGPDTADDPGSHDHHRQPVGDG